MGVEFGGRIGDGGNEKARIVGASESVEKNGSKVGKKRCMKINICHR